jgi:hypothetical protein
LLNRCGVRQNFESAAMVNSQKWMMLCALIATTLMSVGCRNCGLFRGGGSGCYPQNCAQVCANTNGATINRQAYNNQAYNNQAYNNQAYNNQAYNNQAYAGQNYNARTNTGVNGIIPPPATGTLNIPSVARNTLPYNNQNRYGSGLNTNAPAPTPANGNRYNRSNGWRAADGRTGLDVGSTNSGSNAVSVLANNQNTNPNSGVRTAANTAPTTGSTSNSNLNRGGTSYVDSPNYTTTAVNETYDRTRLPINDASNVQAPSQYYQAGVANQVARVAPANTNNGVYGNFGNYYTPNNAVAMNPQIQQNGYVGSFGNANYYSQSGFGQGNTQVAQAGQARPTVLAQSTATYDPYSGGTRQADWRDRELGSESFR